MDQTDKSLKIDNCENRVRTLEETLLDFDEASKKKVQSLKETVF